VDKESIDFIYKMADSSGDGKVSFSEFYNLFDNILKDALI